MHSITTPHILILLLFTLLGQTNCFSFQLLSVLSSRSSLSTTLPRVPAVAVARTLNVENEEVSKAESTKISFDWNEQWYPVLPLEYLNDAEDGYKPRSIVVLGRKLVVWKSDDVESGWSVMDDSCPHRRSPLSTGQVVNNGSTCSLRCRYHGWEFDAKGACTKIPMTPATSVDSQEAKLAYKTNSYPTQAVGGLLWVYLGRKGVKDSQLPEIPTGSLLSEEENAVSSWGFFVNPVSYLSLVENSLDPSHAPFTHEGMTGFSGSLFSPEDFLPIAKYDVVETEGEHGGFKLEHTPYQLSVAKVAGENCLTTRAFIPPCTVAVSALPVFKIKIWFVPSTPTETTVMAHVQATETNMMKLTRKFPKLRNFFGDWSHSSRLWSDNNYRFNSQDRITMQGQEERKLTDARWWDLTPTPSDKGVATFQKWTRDVGGLGPFPFMNGVSPGFISRQFSIWDSHGKYCPKCQRTMKRVVALEKIADRWFTRALVAGGISSTLAAFTSLVTFRLGKLSAFLTPWSILFLLAAVGCRSASEWSKSIQSRMYGNGDEFWQRRLEIFGYSSK